MYEKQNAQNMTTETNNGYIWERILWVYIRSKKFVI